MMSDQVVVFTLFYCVFSLCVVYPQTEFISSGLTITNLFSKYLGSENESFIQYHTRRIALTMLVHSVLPLGYVLCLFLINDTTTTNFFWSDSSFFIWQLFVSSAIILPLTVLFKLYHWSENNWDEHPVIKHMKPFSNQTDTWISVAASINTEFRRIEKLCIETSPIVKVIATENWIIKVTLYNMHIGHQSDAHLILDKSDTHTFSPISGGDIQFVNIQVKSTHDRFEAFSIRVNALDFNELQDRVSKTIFVLPHVKFHKRILDRFVDAFKEQIELNTKYETLQELDPCMGCMVKPSNVKLQKLCTSDSLQESVSGADACTSCHCRPLWCADCMAMWFASRQDQADTEHWLSQKCTCPVCRAKFCVLDVSCVQMT